MLNFVNDLPEGLHRDIKSGNLADVTGFIESLIDDGDPIFLKQVLNEKIEGKTPLHVFAGYQSRGVDKLPIAKLLIDNGADVNATDPNGNTALHTCVTTFIEFDKFSLVVEDRKSTEEYLKNYMPFMGLLINNGCNTKLKNHVGETALGNLNAYLANCGTNYLIEQNLIKPKNYGPYTGPKIDENSLKAAYQQYAQSQGNHVANVNDNAAPKQSKCAVM